MADLLQLFNELDRHSDDKLSKDLKILRAPFGYPGGKTKSVPNILKHLPYRKVYVEPFGGSGAVLLARQPSQLEVLNDRYAGVVSFYRCLRNPEKYKQLIDYLDLTIHSREDFVDAKQTWCDETDDVVRAAKWYYMVNYSFSSLGRNFGRATSPRGLIAGKISNKLKTFPHLHARLRYVQIENQDWESCLSDYDSYDTVFYIDPPYVDAFPGTFTHELNIDGHRELLDRIFRLKGFVAVSGYSNPLYENQKWTDRFSWSAFVSMESCSFSDANNKKCLETTSKRQYVEEVLWVREHH
jgi:DNA adenine methylase